MEVIGDIFDNALEKKRGDASWEDQLREGNFQSWSRKTGTFVNFKSLSFKVKLTEKHFTDISNGNIITQ